MSQQPRFSQGKVTSTRSSRKPETSLKSFAFRPPTKIACRFLMDLRMFLVPVGMQLEVPSCLDNRKVVAGSTHKLQPYREILLGEPASDEHARKPADVADVAKWTGQI